MNYNESSDSQLIAAYLNGDQQAKAVIIQRHRQPHIECLTEKVGDAKAASIMADILLDDVFARAAEYDAEQESLFCWALGIARDRFDAWEAPVHRLKMDIELSLSEEIGVTLSTDEFDRLVSVALKAELSKPFHPASYNMRNTIDRLIEAGYFAQVHEAGQFARARSEYELRWKPEVAHPTNELFTAIDGLEDCDELNAVADYIEEQFADDYAAA